MIRNYIKIAWKVLLRRKFFTFVSVMGISFTLLVLMVLVALVDHMRKPARPGSRLDRSLYVENIRMKQDTREIFSFPSYYFLDRYVKPMKTPEAIAIHSLPTTENVYVDNHKLELQMKYTDAAFWHILEFEFTEGGPYGETGVANADRVGVITDRTKRQLFGDESAIGKYVESTNGNYRVIGVIHQEEIPMFSSYADIYVPITTSQSAMTATGLYRNCMASILARDRRDFSAIRSEYTRQLARANSDYRGEYDTIMCPIKTSTDLFADVVPYFLELPVGGEDETVFMVVGFVGLMILFMLFPALNLININVSRIIERSSEIGVRKAFGASSRTLVGQFLVENVILTVMAGAIAYLLSLVVLHVITASGLIPYGKFVVNIRVFVYCLGISLFFGLVSGVLPAYRMSKLQPVEALRGSEL